MFHSKVTDAATRPQWQSGSRAAEDVASLISRYPNLSEYDLARLINSYRALSALDAALIISDENLGPKLDGFFKDHRSKIRTPFRQYAILVAIGVFGTAIIAGATLMAP